MHQVRLIAISEKDTFDENQHNSIYKVEEIEKGKLLSKTWYAIDNGDGTYSQKISEEKYTWEGKLLLSKTFDIYDLDGETILESQTTTYAMQSGTTSKSKITKRNR